MSILNFVTKEVADSRYEICKTCERFNTLKFCKECGCFMPAKTKLAYVKCPLGKWGDVSNSWQTTDNAPDNNDWGKPPPHPM
jgi:hypothetical protein